MDANEKASMGGYARAGFDSTSEHQITALAAAYDELASEQLEALANLDHDPNRRQIDDALSTVLGLPSLGPIRELLAREPGLTARDIAPHQTQPALNPDKPEDEDALI